MITLTLNLNPNSTYPILAREGISSPGIVPTLTVGDRCNLSLKFWDGPQGSSALTSKQLDGFSFIKFGSKVSKASSSLVIYVDEFTEHLDSGVYSYQTELNLNTVELIAALDGKDTVEVFTDVEITFLTGQRQTLQFKHVVRNQVVDDATPPEFITEPTAIVFADMVAAYEDTHPGATAADFLASLQSTTPGPTGYMLGTAGVEELTVSRDLTSYDVAKLLWAQTPVTVTIPAWLDAGFQCSFLQKGSGQITFAAGGGMTVENEFGYTMTRGSSSPAFVFVIASDYAVTTGSMV